MKFSESWSITILSIHPPNTFLFRTFLLAGHAAGNSTENYSKPWQTQSLMELDWNFHRTMKFIYILPSTSSYHQIEARDCRIYNSHKTSLFSSKNNWRLLEGAGARVDVIICSSPLLPHNVVGAGIIVVDNYLPKTKTDKRLHIIEINRTINTWVTCCISDRISVRCCICIPLSQFHHITVI